MMSATTNNQQMMLYRLQVFGPDGAVFQHELKPGHVLIVGSSAACGLRLDHRSVSGMHCSMEPDDEGIKLRDWSSDEGTFVDTSRVETEIYVQPGSEIRIADYRLVVHGVPLTARRSMTTDVASPPPIPVQVEPADVTLEQGAFLSDEPFSSDTDRSSLIHHDDIPSDAIDNSWSSRDSSEPEWNRDFDPWDSPDEPNFSHPTERDALESHGTSASGYDRDAFRDDTNELLQAELEFLRAELADRDARLHDLETDSRSTIGVEPIADTISKDEAESLVGRLEQLLIELDEKDEQIATLSDLLRDSEDAVEAADEERQQMETWIGEVERRVGQWQEEWHAERDRLKQSIDEVTEQRDRAEQQLASGGAAAAPAQSTSEEFLQQIREEYSRLKEKFLALEQDREQLQSQLENVGKTDIEQRLKAAVDAALREERLELAQEKAAIARLKSEVAKQQEDFESRSLRNDDDHKDSADLRIRAFREHLREIHETDPRPVQAPSFADRMGKLWRKLEGRPLDTD